MTHYRVPGFRSHLPVFYQRICSHLGHFRLCRRCGYRESKGPYTSYPLTWPYVCRIVLDILCYSRMSSQEAIPIRFLAWLIPESTAWIDKVDHHLLCASHYRWLISAPRGVCSTPEYHSERSCRLVTYCGIQGSPCGTGRSDDAVCPSPQPHAFPQRSQRSSRHLEGCRVDLDVDF